MTLIEIMIVVALMATLMATLVFGSGMFIGANRRAAATLVVTAVRKGLAHANTTGKPTRMAVDLTAGTVTLEESSSTVALRRDSVDVAEENEEQALRAYEDEAVAAAEAAAESFLSGSGSAGDGFTPVPALGGDEQTGARAVDGGVKFRLVQTEHDSEPVIEGTAYVYFWPGGETERAVVQLGSGEDDDGLTVEISPLTGRAKIKRGRVPLPEARFLGDDYSEREEP
jgi:general secretion pathway protein H